MTRLRSLCRFPARNRKPGFLAIILALLGSLGTVQGSSPTEVSIRVMTVVICQQEDFLQFLLAPYLANNKLNIDYSTGHHSEVAKAVESGEVDFVITHSKVRKMQKLEAAGVLREGRTLFANPMVFLGPKGDPAQIRGLKTPLSAVEKIQHEGFCFVINSHDRLSKIQNKLLQASGANNACIINSDNRSTMDLAFENQAYTMWALHPYAAKSLHRLEPVLIPDKALLENMTGWIVAASDAEAESRKLLDYLESPAAKKRLADFRLSMYPDVQAWWPSK